jgi:hypothetical protein
VGGENLPCRINSQDRAEIRNRLRPFRTVINQLTGSDKNTWFTTPFTGESVPQSQPTVVTRLSDESLVVIIVHKQLNCNGVPYEDGKTMERYRRHCQGTKMRQAIITPARPQHPCDDVSLCHQFFSNLDVENLWPLLETRGLNVLVSRMD